MRLDPRRLCTASVTLCGGRVVVSCLMLSVATIAGAQMPGTPVLQNAWSTPGIVMAFNFSGGDGSVYGAAASWSAPSSRLQVSAGTGLRSRSDVGTKAVYGARLAVPIYGEFSAFGFAAFAGVGATSSGAATSADSVATTTQFPVGLALGWRHALGVNRGVSLYVTPSYLFLTGGTDNAGLFRTAVGVDFGLAKAVGLTGGVEFGASHTRTEGGPTGTLYGLGISYAFGRR